jgi:hypothetical protein
VKPVKNVVSLAFSINILLLERDVKKNPDLDAN